MHKPNPVFTHASSRGFCSVPVSIIHLFLLHFTSSHIDHSQHTGGRLTLGLGNHFPLMRYTLASRHPAPPFLVGSPTFSSPAFSLEFPTSSWNASSCCVRTKKAAFKLPDLNSSSGPAHAWRSASQPYTSTNNPAEPLVPCLQAAIVLSTSVTFLGLPGLDSYARIAGFLGIFLSTASLTSSIMVLFRLKSDASRASTNISGEGFVIPPVSLAISLVHSVSDPSDDVTTETRLCFIPSTRFPGILSDFFPRRHISLFIPWRHNHEPFCDYSSFQRLYEVDGCGCGRWVRMHVGCVGLDFATLMRHVRDPALVFLLSIVCIYSPLVYHDKAL
jgi:hypothetical protein